MLGLGGGRPSRAGGTFGVAAGGFVMEDGGEGLASGSALGSGDGLGAGGSNVTSIAGSSASIVRWLSGETHHRASAVATCNSTANAAAVGDMRSKRV